jgi:hypothetical protein
MEQWANGGLLVAAQGTVDADADNSTLPTDSLPWRSSRGAARRWHEIRLFAAGSGAHKQSQGAPEQSERAGGEGIDVGLAIGISPLRAAA